VVAALDEGIPTRVLREACGLSSSQLARWRAAAAEIATPLSPPRVLSVVDDGPQSRGGAHERVEVRVGPWMVSVGRAAD
jgi:hypothetical protein